MKLSKQVTHCDACRSENISMVNQPDWGTVWDCYSLSDRADRLNPISLVSAVADSAVSVQEGPGKQDALR